MRAAAWGATGFVVMSLVTAALAADTAAPAKAAAGKPKKAPVASASAKPKTLAEQSAAAASASAASAAAPLATNVAASGSGTPLVPGATPSATSETVTRADALLGSMQRRAQEVALVLRVARQRDDKAQVTCANDALNRADMSVRLGREKSATIAGLVKTGDPDEAERQMRLLEELSSTQAKTVELAGSCIGQVSRTINEKTEVRVEKPSGAPVPAPSAK